MPRQTFITKDFFVDASEKIVKQTIFAMPSFFSAIKFIEENSKLQYARFVYEKSDSKSPAYIDVSLLPLNENQTKITLHGTYVNGAIFYKDEFMLNALKNFESAIYAGLDGNLSYFEPQTPGKTTKQKLLLPINLILAFIGVLFIWRKKIG